MFKFGQKVIVKDSVEFYGGAIGVVVVKNELKFRNGDLIDYTVLLDHNEKSSFTEDELELYVDPTVDEFMEINKDLMVDLDE